MFPAAQPLLTQGFIPTKEVVHVVPVRIDRRVMTDQLSGSSHLTSKETDRCSVDPDIGLSAIELKSSNILAGVTESKKVDSFSLPNRLGGFLKSVVRPRSFVDDSNTICRLLNVLLRHVSKVRSPTRCKAVQTTQFSVNMNYSNFIERSRSLF